MPSPFTSSFASAAAGHTNSDDAPIGRNTGSGDWSRARVNGATATFRRPSVATGSSQKDSPQASNPPPSAGSVYVPPHMNSNYQSSYFRNGFSTEFRYSRSQLLDLFREQQNSGSSIANLDQLYVDGWKPAGVNGSSNDGWGKKDDQKDAAGPEICWEHDGSVEPLALFEMTEEEKEVFTSSVNSPLKPPTQNNHKDGTPNSNILNRRTSITQNTSNSLPSSRPGARRRESGGDLLQNTVTSPTNNRFSKDESGVTSPPPSLLRRKTDYKDTFGPSLEDKDKSNEKSGNDISSPFGLLKRTATQPTSASVGGPSSPWSAAPPSAGFSPMGAFGSFGLPGPPVQTPTSGDKKGGIGSLRGESRFKGLMGRGSSEDLGPKVKEKASINSLERLPESRNEQQHSPWAGDRSSQTQPRNSDLCSDEEVLPGTGGSVTLLDDDTSAPGPPGSRYRTSNRQNSYDEIGFSSLNMGNDMPPFRELMQRRDLAPQQTPHTRAQGLTPMNEPMSPTNTNPYQSPEAEKSIPDTDFDDPDIHHMQYQNPSQYGQAMRSFNNQLDPTSGDRSQTSSASLGRGFPSLGGLGNISGVGGGPWSAAPGAIGTPSRTNPGQSGLGESAYAGLNDISSPQSVLGGTTFFGAGALGSTGRGSKISSLLPSTMQEQMRAEQQGYGDNADNFLRHSGHDAPGFKLRELESSTRLTRSGMDDLLGNAENRTKGFQNLVSPFTATEHGQALSSQAPPSSAAAQTPFSSGPPGSYFPRTQDPDTSSNQMPAPQQRQMVMPDRMRWIYRDPQGATQGPWSGLEMHDWYKAGFFSPELQVKKLEDADYEPLAQLIRRIGNSREPFLVPQIGIAHGSSNIPSSTAPGNAGTVSTTTTSASQPPFPGNFPSFGTTLSAEQQNALERRKQEEQYLMARQKEHLATTQLALKQQQMMQSGQLHHHSSAQSLHSQPSYGSITSPMGYQPSPGQGPVQAPASGPMPGFFERAPGPLNADALSPVREDEMPGFMERFNSMGLGRGGQMPFNQDNQVHQQQVAAIMQERARQQREHEQYDVLRQDNDGQRVTAERLEQYHQLRAQEDQNQLFQPSAPIGGHMNRQISEMDLQAQHQRQEHGDYQDRSQQLQENQKQPEPPSLSEQVQKAAAKQTIAAQPQSPWAKVDSGMPQPFPPPQSQSPMPAPTPQRNRQSVADALNAESQSPSRTESTDTPSAAIAPWAKDPAEGSKGPSLKEIQAMEAKKVALQEEVAAAARRTLAEQERLAQQNQPVAPAPGLPSSATWANSPASAAPAASNVSAWSKPGVSRTTVATPHKTLSQIQKEEEARKNRQAASSAAASNVPTAPAGTKSYAGLAGKAAVPTPLQTNNAAWTTVGASGKAKTPVAPAPSLTPRTASGGIIQPSAAPLKPKVAANVGAKGPSSQQHANEEFQKWVKQALSKGLNSNIGVDSFVANLLLLPPEVEIISDSIYAASQTLNGRRFAEEFVQRRKLADRGVVPDASNTGFSSPSNTGETKSSGGWSEVAKKGPTSIKEETNSAFKVVGGKKKGGKR